MITTIGGWLAGKVSGIIIFILACLSIPFFVGMVVQTVRIDGLDLGGWYAITGYKTALATDETALVTLRGNNTVLDAGLKKCNGGVTDVADAAKALHEATAALVAAKEALADQNKKNIAAINAIKSSGEKCPVAESILNAGFQ